MKKAYSLIWNEVAKSLNPDLVTAIDNLKILSLPMKDLESQLPVCEFTGGKYRRTFPDFNYLKKYFPLIERRQIKSIKGQA
jgi:hypothetical protein